MKSPAWLVALTTAVALWAPPGLLAQKSAPPPDPWKTPWAYDGPLGPSHWGDLDPTYAACKTGREQSPIDIRGAAKADPDLPGLDFDYHPAPLDHLINNGYAVRVNYHPAEQSDLLRVGAERYKLVQFHFHVPSEEYVDGKQYPMEIHLMHQSNDGRIVGVAVLVRAGHPNPLVQSIRDHMPASKGPEHDVAGVTIDPTALLPADRSYYTYMGSISAPPCSEGVTWFVLKTPIEVSPAQIRALARVYSHDARPLQPLNGRVVRQSP